MNVVTHLLATAEDQGGGLYTTEFDAVSFFCKKYQAYFSFYKVHQKESIFGIPSQWSHARRNEYRRRYLSAMSEPVCEMVRTVTDRR